MRFQIVTTRASASVCLTCPQHTVLSRKFVEVMTQYNETQVAFRERSKGRIQRQLEISKRHIINPCEAGREVAAFCSKFELMNSDEDIRHAKIYLSFSLHIDGLDAVACSKTE